MGRIQIKKYNVITIYNNNKRKPYTINLNFKLHIILSYI